MLNDEDKVSISPLDVHADYRQLRVTIEAFCDAKEIGNYLITKNTHDINTNDLEKFEMNCKEALNLIVRSLTNKLLIIVLSVVGKHFQMLKRVDKRYDSQSRATRISKITEIVSMR